jgi:hypothetical protein
MPYIKKEGKRCRLDGHIGKLSTALFKIGSSAGELNYTITKLLHQYILSKGLSYATVNEVIGVLECAKLELYRMVAAPYEQTKRMENGGVSSLDGMPKECLVYSGYGKCQHCDYLAKNGDMIAVDNLDESPDQLFTCPKCHKKSPLYVLKKVYTAEQRRALEDAR